MVGMSVPSDTETKNKLKADIKKKDLLNYDIDISVPISW